VPRPAAPLAARPDAARRFLRAALGLEAPHRDVGAALDHHGAVQLDPINVCGRMHDLILRNRVAGYREGDLLRHLHGAWSPGERDGAPPLAPGARTAFEHYSPLGGVLCAFPLEAWPHLVPAMVARRRAPWRHGGRLTADERPLARRVLAELAERGPLSSDDIAHEGRAVTAWGTQGRLAKAVLDKLFFHGRVLIAARRAFRRIYDLPERVLPAAVLSAPRPTAAETARFLALLRLRQRRLVILRAPERRLLGDRVREVRIPGCPPCLCLREDAPALAAAAEAAPEAGADGPVRLLAPLDPLIYDRRLTAALWGFEYTWEVYTPAARRVRGYYALPVLAGDHLVGHLEPRADRERGRLVVVSRKVKRGVRVQPAVRELAGFLGLRTGGGAR
jgi:uncharacterized protein YcaQ